MAGMARAGAATEHRAGAGAGVTPSARAVPGLLALAPSGAQPPLVRATAAQMLVPRMRTPMLTTARELLPDAEPEVRIAALEMIEPADPGDRPGRGPLLSDPLRGVRMEAARVLAGIPETQMPEGQREAYRHALGEYIEVQRQDADWPNANTNLGNLYLRLGRFDEAVVAYRRALKLDPQFASAGSTLPTPGALRGMRKRSRRPCAKDWRNCRVRPTCFMRWGWPRCARATRLRP